MRASFFVQVVYFFIPIADALFHLGFIFALSSAQHMRLSLIRSPLVIRTLGLVFIWMSSSLSLQAQSLTELEAALEAARQTNDYPSLASAYYNLALYEESNNQNLEKSFEHLSRGLDYYELEKDSAGISSSKFHIARQLLNNGMYDEAYGKMEELKGYYRNMDDDSSLARLELQRYRYFFEQLEMDSCDQILNLLGSYFAEGRDGDLELDYLYVKVTHHEFLKDYDLALQDAETCVSRSQQGSDPLAQAKCLLARGRVLQTQGQDVLALRDLRQSNRLLGDVPYSTVRLESYNLLAQTYKKLNMDPEAYSYVTRYAQLQDSILNEGRLVALNNLTYRYESKEKATEIKLLEMDKEYVQKSNDQQRRALIVLGLSFVGLLAGMYFIVRFYTDKIKNARIIDSQTRRINQQKIKELEDEMQINSMQSMIAGQEVERERIAKDLHDSLGGLLSAIKLQVDKIPVADEQGKKNSDAVKATDLLDVAVSEVRTISQDLQPGALKSLGLVPALYDLVNRYQSTSGPDITFQHYDVPSVLDQNFALSIYRIIQEILNNAIKHAQASEIFVQLNIQGDDMVVNVEDDGIGFDPERKYTSMGLENIRSRVNYLKGTLDIDSRKGQGSSFFIHVPYQ